MSKGLRYWLLGALIGTLFCLLLWGLRGRIVWWSAFLLVFNGGLASISIARSRGKLPPIEAPKPLTLFSNGIPGPQAGKTNP